MTYQIRVLPRDLTIEVKEGRSVMSALKRKHLTLYAACGGKGQCGSCRARVASDAPDPDENESKLLTPDELANGWRLLCRLFPTRGARLTVDLEDTELLAPFAVEGIKARFDPDPPVVSVRTAPDVLPTDDATRIVSLALDDLAGSLGRTVTPGGAGVSESLAAVLAANDFKADVLVRGDEILTARTPSEAQPFGFAIDVGTSKLAVYLVSLPTGEVIASMAVPNPQASFGEDLITRLHAAEDATEADAMKNLLLEALQFCFNELAGGASLEALDACEVVAVGNTGMHHLFLGLPVSQLIRAPFSPSSSAPQDLRTRDLGLGVMPTSHIYMPALIGGFVGSDHLAAIVASRVFLRGAPTLLVDVGTNTEVTLVAAGRMACCSCASGPAFEGAGLRYGLRACQGAISRVSLDEKAEFVVETMGDAPPRGICGSGIVDALACMLRLGSVEASGRLVKGAPGVREEEGELVFLLAEREGQPPITISQDDVREIQKAKGAIRGGIEMLLERAHLGCGDLESIILAGSFGSFIDPASALALGMFPPLPPDSFTQAGNAAGMGARVLLCSVEERDRSESLAREVEHVDLATYPGSGYFFAACMTLGEKALQESLARLLKTR